MNIFFHGVLTFAKNQLGPIVSLLGAASSGWFYWKNWKLNQKNANRSIYVDGQKFLIEICKLLTGDPLLWNIYDDSPVRREKVWDTKTPMFQARLRAFAHLHLNMFEIMMNEVPPPEPSAEKRNASNVWYDYLEDTFNRSHLVREILEEKTSDRIWSESLLTRYRDWKLRHQNCPPSHF